MKALVFAIDDAYVLPLQVLWHSLYQTQSVPSGVEVFILHDHALSPENCQQLIQFFALFRTKPHFVSLEQSVPADLSLSVSDHFTVATYHRLFCASVLPPHIDYVVYLDVDAVATASLRPLFNLDLGDAPIAAVDHLSRADELRLWGAVGGTYFNAGVLVINLRWWREANAEALFRQILSHQADRIHWWDQDVLNIAFANRWIRLPVWFNANHVVRRMIDPRLLSRHVRLLHFTTGRKPWNCDQPTAVEMVWHQLLCDLDEYFPKPSFQAVLDAGLAGRRPRCYPSRNDMIRDLLQDGMVAAEIGVFEGEFSRRILGAAALSRLYLVDLFSGQVQSGDEHGNHAKIVDLDPVYDALLAEYESADHVTVVKSDSRAFLDSLEADSLDFVYIDADHGYAGCSADLEAAFRVVKSGGFIAGHDYSMNPAKTMHVYAFGVRRAVDEFCLRCRQCLSAKALDGCVSYAIRVQK